jgi:hypothetical protein
METTSGANPFDLTKVMNECRAYIDAIDDYQIDVSGKRVITPDKIIEYGSRENIKVLLIEFLYECKEEATKGERHLIQFLRSKRNYWQATQAQTIGQLNEIISRKTENEKVRFENQHKQFLDFFHHNYTLIDLIIARLTGLPLGDFLQLKLKRAGVEWIIVGSQLMNDQNSISTPGTDNNNERIDTRPAVALMLFYLEKIGYFKAASSVRAQIRDKEAPLYGFTPDGLYNEYSRYNIDSHRLKKSTIQHIEKAIQLLEQSEWYTAAAYAKADLTYCKRIEDL